MSKVMCPVDPEDFLLENLQRKLRISRLRVFCMEYTRSVDSYVQKARRGMRKLALGLNGL
jgi:hypothetical protein